MADFLILAQLEGSNTTEMVKMTQKSLNQKLTWKKLQPAFWIWETKVRTGIAQLLVKI
jgi:hypothetical protein